MLKQIKRYGVSNVITLSPKELEWMQLEIGDIIDLDIKFVRRPENVQKKKV